MLRFVLALFAVLPLSAQTLNVCISGPASIHYFTTVTPGSPPSITLQTGAGANYAANDVVAVADIQGIPALQHSTFRINTKVGDVITLKNSDGSALAAPGEWYAGGKICKTTAVSINNALPYMLLDNGGPDATRVTDPDGTGPLKAPKLTDYPTDMTWVKMNSDLTTLCNTAATCIAAAPTSQPSGSLLITGQLAVFLGLRYTADNVAYASELTEAKNMVNNFELYSRSIGEAPFMGCVKSGQFCGYADGEALDHSSWNHWRWVQAFDLIKNHLTSQEKTNFALKLWKGMNGEACVNAYEPDTGTVSWSGTAVTGFGTNWTSALNGKWIYLAATDTTGGAKWKKVLTVNSPTSITLVSAAIGTGTNRPFTTQKVWNSSHCGVIWTGYHHNYAPNQTVHRQAGKLQTAITSVAQSQITLTNADVWNRPFPFMITYGTSSAAEIMKVTAKTGAVFDVVRGQYGSTPIASIGAGSYLYAAETAGRGPGSCGSCNNDVGTAAGISRGIVTEETLYHNLAWAKMWAGIHAGIATAPYAEQARLGAERNWNIWYMTLYPFWKDNFGWMQHGGTNYHDRYITWIGWMGKAWKSATNGVVDILGGEWQVKTAHLYGPQIYPWDKHRFFTYTDSASSGEHWDKVAANLGGLFVMKNYPNDDRSGWPLWYFKMEQVPSNDVWTRFDRYAYAELWSWFPADAQLTCPNTTPGFKCINSKAAGSLPHFFDIDGGDYDPTTLCPTPTPPYISCYANPDNGFRIGISYSDMGTSATMFKYQGGGLSGDHMPYADPLGYQIWRDSADGFQAGALMTGSGNAACTTCGNILGHTSPLIVTSTANFGIARDLSSLTNGANQCGSRGVRTSVLRPLAGTADYLTFTMDARCGYRTGFGINVANRSFFHFKSGAPSTQDYIFVYDRLSTSTAQRWGVPLIYHNSDQGEPSFTGWARTDGVISYAPRATSKIHTNYIYSSASFDAYVESDYNSDSYYTRKVIRQETTPTTGLRNVAVWHKASTSSATPATTYTKLTSSANADAFLAADGTLPRVVVALKDLSLANTTVSWTVPATANTQTLVQVPDSSIIDVTKGGSPILTGLNSGSAGIIHITGHGAGEFVATVSGSAAPPEITTVSLPGGTEDVAYNQTLVATGCVGGCTWDIQSGAMCDGLSLSSAGTISGTPTTAQTCNFTARATDTQPLDDTQLLSIVIAAAATDPLDISIEPLISCTLAASCTGSMVAVGGSTPYTYSIANPGVLPPGLSLNSGTGAITGTPTEIGDTALTARVVDNAAAADTQSFRIRVLPNTGLTIRRAVAAGTSMLVTFSGAANANWDCKAILRRITDGEINSEITVSVGPSMRSALFQNLIPGESYTPQLSCNTVGAQGDVVTMPESSSGTEVVKIRLSAPQGRSITNVLVEYGFTEALGTSATVACTASCTVPISVPKGNMLHYRWTWRDAGNATVAGPSESRVEPVP